MNDSAFSLSEQQIRFFETFGYLGFPGLMADRIDEITEAFEAVWSERGGGHNGQPHAGEARSCIVPFIDQSAALSSLIDDPRIRALAATLLGDDFNYMGSDGNYYVGDTGWHSDGWHHKGKPQHLKIAFYLDPLTRDSGALRVIPGSHRDGDGYARVPAGADPPQSCRGRRAISGGWKDATCRPWRRWKRSRATWFALTTTPSTQPLAAAQSGECSLSTYASAIQRRACRICATTYPVRRAFGSNDLAYGPQMLATAGRATACTIWNRSWPTMDTALSRLRAVASGARKMTEPSRG